MPKYTVRFDTNFRNKRVQLGVVGVIEVEAESAEHAQKIVEDIDLCELLGTCDPAGVEIESVELIQPKETP